ncbi:unnamed protein product [Porites lobata]|uniref:ATPase AAA-type core domain-containing protein n=1 Tax=Porites lobata TaxID=104759 RepID=A0ABN8SF68_9CNID|nr:unnamed protein product [Porites lobata]
MTATVKIYDIASKVHTKGFQRQEYECSVAELLTAIDWDKKDRGVGFWNDTMVFYQVLLEKLEVEMEVTVNCPESPCNYLIVPASWEEGDSLTRLLEVVQTGVTKDIELSAAPRRVIKYRRLANVFAICLNRTVNAKVDIPLTLSEFSLSNPGELMPLYGSSANNVILWGAISHELGHYTSIVRITATSREWLVSHRASYKITAGASGKDKKDPPVYHMVLMGNPGTGKMTIGRLMAGILKDLGITKTSKLVEVQRPDLVASFLGQTASRRKCVSSGQRAAYFS